MTAPALPDLQRAFSEAEQAMVRGDLPTAARLAESVGRHLPRNVAVLRLQATIARRSGLLDRADALYRAALALAPKDINLLIDHAGLAAMRGAAEDAIAGFTAALLQDPNQIVALRGLGSALEAAGRPDAAAVHLKAALAHFPADAALWQALGAALRAGGDMTGAADAFDRALALSPADPRLRHARAHVEQERGRDARPLYRDALRAIPSDPELRLGVFSASLSMGDIDGALAEGAALIADYPQWVRAQAAVARLRWQAGDRSAFAAGFEDALRAQPKHGAMWADYLRALVRAGRTAAVYDGAARARVQVGASATLDIIEARAAFDAGDLARAGALLEPLQGKGLVEADLALLPYWLKAKAPERAAKLGEEMRQGPAAGLAVPYLGVAWRVLGDSRAAWLEEQPGLVKTVRLDVDTAALANVLRGLHVAKNAPLDQSLRGGTQTEGALFARDEPEIRQLARAALEAVGDYVAALPPTDNDHPFLSVPRGAMRFSGSWSVRLADGGFHVAHVHSEGCVSSAFYVALPEASGMAKAGWLVLGEPPVELGLALAPIREVEPKAGLLALFPSTMWHGTRPFPAGERLTVAFDAVPRR